MCVETSSIVEMEINKVLDTSLIQQVQNWHGVPYHFELLLRKIQANERIIQYFYCCFQGNGMPLKSKCEGVFTP